MFFEKLIDLLAAGWDWIAPMAVVDAYEKGVVLRWGRYHRTVSPGYRLKWPFAERMFQVSTALTTLRLPQQRGTTKDEKRVSFGAIVKYRVVDPKPYICDLTDQTDALIDVSMGALLKAVRATEAIALLNDPPEAKVAAAVRRQVKDFGFEVDAVTFTDLVHANVLHLVGAAATGKDAAN